MLTFFGMGGGECVGSSARDGSMRCQIYNCLALDLRIEIHVCHCAELASTIGVVRTVGLLILVSSAVLQKFWILVEAEN